MLNEIIGRPSRPAGRGWRFVGTTLVTAALAACGGGGGGGTSYGDGVEAPPTAAATIDVTSDGAIGGVRAAVAAADRAIDAQASLLGLDFLLGDGATVSGRAGAKAAGTVQAQDSGTATCYDVFEVMPCAGTIAVSSDFDLAADQVAAGRYLALDFRSIAFGSGAEAVTLDGGLRIDFETSFDFLVGFRVGDSLRITFDGLQGSVGDVAYGPIDFSARLQQSNVGLQLTADGVRYTALEVGSSGGAAVISAGTVRLEHPAQAGAYVDVGFASWQRVDGRPVAGSSAAVSVGTRTITVSVQSTTATTVRYRAVITESGGTLASYDILATYPLPSGGVPVYTVLPPP